LLEKEIRILKVKRTLTVVSLEWVLFSFRN
jgi:hypothetical protein